jgi:hypothetical protein
MHVLLDIDIYERRFELTEIVITLRNNSIPKGGEPAVLPPVNF